VESATACTFSESARITAEIGQRLVELNELKRFSAADLVVRLASVYHVSPHAFDMVIALMHGGTECIAYSYNVRAISSGLTKQAIHVRHQVAMKALRQHFPELETAIEDIRKSGLLHDDQMSHADALRAAGDGHEGEALP